jgi:hypothetical protein
MAQKKQLAITSLLGTGRDNCMNTTLVSLPAQASALTIANMSLPEEISLPGMDAYDFDRTKLVGISFPEGKQTKVCVTPDVLKQVIGKGGRIWPTFNSLQTGTKVIRSNWRYNALGEAWRFVWRAASMPSPHKTGAKMTVFRVDLLLDVEPSRMDPVKDLEDMVVLVADDAVRSLAVVGYPLREDHPSVGNAALAVDALNALYHIQASGKSFEAGQKAGRYSIKNIEGDGRVLHLSR